MAGAAAQSRIKGTAATAVLVLVLTILSACGKKAGLAETPTSTGVLQQLPPISELQQRLDEEFQRLGIDPTRVTAAAPQGERNAVFDLSATLIDPDGPGGDPPTGVELTWTERLLGDYDQNSEVNSADLAPVAARFGQIVEYDDPQLHGGFVEWPSGDPDGSGATNWRNARVDGDGNSEINAADIATIAGNWQTVLSGYRVYARAGGAAQYMLLPDPSDASAPLTQHRPVKPDATKPVCFRHTYDLPHDANGIFQFYVAGYHSATATESPASPALGVNVETGTLNIVPVAVLSATPPKGAPGTTVLLDASTSYDPGGNIIDYSWDLDGDGVFDAGDDEVAVRGQPQAQFRLGDEPGLHNASVRVTDNDAAVSEATALLTAQGWLALTIEDDDLNSVGLHNRLAVVNGRPAIAYYEQPYNSADGHGTLKYAWSADPYGAADWQIEVVADNKHVKSIALAEIGAGPGLAYEDGLARQIFYLTGQTTGNDLAWTDAAVVDTTLDELRSSGLSLAEVGGGPALSYVKAYDVFGEGAELRFGWSTVPAGTSWQSIVVDADGPIYAPTSLVLASGKPVIAYRNFRLDGSNGVAGLRFAASFSADGQSGWQAHTVDNTSVVRWPSLAVINGKPAIAYCDHLYAGQSGPLKLALSTDSGWSIFEPISSDARVHTSLAVINGHPASTYTGAPGGALIYAVGGSTLGSESWSSEPVRVESSDEGFNVYDISPESCLVELNGRAGLSYRSGNGQSDDLKYAVLFE